MVDVEQLLIHAQLGVRLLKNGIERLEQDNARLRHELENDSVLTSQPKYSDSATDDDTDLEALGIRGLEKEVESLKQTISKVKKENARLRMEIDDLRKSSLEEEVENLKTARASDEKIDPVYRMRKLLRRFSDLMLVSTTSDDIKCGECGSPVKVRECSALVCRHLVCHDCLPRISRAATRDTEALRCPLCRQDTPREELELVHMTETDRWDELTKVAQAWMAFDRRGELESSEEEDEDNFITDGDGTSEATSEAANNEDQTKHSASAQDPLADLAEAFGQASPARSARGPVSSDSPNKLKRTRMEVVISNHELVAKRKRT